MNNDNNKNKSRKENFLIKHTDKDFFLQNLKIQNFLKQTPQSIILLIRKNLLLKAI